MKKSLLITILFTLFFVCCCTNKKKQIQNSSLVELNVNNALNIDFVKIIDSTSCIPLTSESNNISYIWKIKEYKGYYYLQSLSNFSISVFDSGGQFIRNIGTQGPGYVSLPADFLINKEAGEIWVLDEKWFVKRYSLDGKEYKGQTKLKFEASSFIQLGSKYLFYNGYCARDLEGNISLTGNDFINTTTYIKTNKSKKIHCKIPQSLFTYRSDSIYSFLPGNDTIYVSTINSLNPKPAYRINFNNDLFTDDKWPENGFSDKEMSDLLKSNKYIFSINSFYQASDKLFFRTKGKYAKFFFVDLNNNKLYATNTAFDSLEIPTLGSNNNCIFFIINYEDLSNYYQTLKNSPAFSSINKILNDQNNVNKPILLKCYITPNSKK